MGIARSGAETFLERCRRYSEALQASKQARHLQPRSAAALTATGMAYHALGSNSDAIRMYHEVSHHSSLLVWCSGSETESS